VTLHLCVLGWFGAAIIVWGFLRSPHSRHTLLGDVSSWVAVVCFAFVGVLLGLADVRMILKAKRATHIG
jgi:hypothetical protein